MSGNKMENINELIGTLSETWKGTLISAGMSCGIFDIINQSGSISLNDLAGKLKFDPVKLENWLYFMKLADIIAIESGKYSLTEKGKLLTPNSEAKELLGLLQLTDYYMKAAIHSNETFKTNESLDKISDGKITRDYQPRVSDNFSMVLVDLLQKYNVGTHDTLLDIGCGGGSFLRMVSTKIPDIQLTGMEANLFVIERGKKTNQELGISNRINLLVGDITEDLEDVPSHSYDWVTAINVFHFVPENKRMELIENMIRISKKGVFATETVIESSMLAASANSLMFLLWNDFTGFFKKNNLEHFNQVLGEKYTNYKFEVIEIMHGKSNLLTVIKS